MKIYELSARYDARKISFTIRPMLSAMKTGHLNYKVMILLFPALLMGRLKSWASGAKQQHAIKKNLESSLNVKGG